MRETAIVVPVPEAERLVGHWRRAHTEDGREGMVAHVTLLYPFVGADVVGERLERVRAALSPFRPFDCSFSTTGRFTDEGVLHLLPEPDEIFRAMTEALVSTFPDHLPYGGVYKEVVPHLTLAQSSDDDLLRRIERDAASLLPIGTRVAAASVMYFVDGDGWRERASIPLV